MVTKISGFDIRNLKNCTTTKLTYIKININYRNICISWSLISFWFGSIVQCHNLSWTKPSFHLSMIWTINKLKQVKFHESSSDHLVTTLLINSKRMSNFIIVQSSVKRSPRKFAEITSLLRCKFYPLNDSICKLYRNWQRYITILWQKTPPICLWCNCFFLCMCVCLCVHSCVHNILYLRQTGKTLKNSLWSTFP